MTNPPETVESVLAEMRKETEPLLWPMIRKFADRLAAAHEREKGVLRKLCDAVKVQAEENFQKYVDANEARIDAEARAEAAEGLLREAWQLLEVEAPNAPITDEILAHLGATND